MITWGVFRGPEGPRFHRNRKGRMCRAYGARDSTILFPRMPGGGTFCRAYGASMDESRFSRGPLRLTLSPEPRITGTAYSVVKEHRALVERAGAHGASDRSPRLVRQV